ncbi:glycoside hydrolase family 57 protein [Gordonia jinhuaensis]|uniref:1,4-alpha-glucan branching enzyme n=1 Tax=Gordonia jinhuaensis TaxID=1517702 RepID=A0A916T160_9ACTN|nr:glycoside hydrolase family 57 protein [Gordonia jinhuaensis]GGB23182.1 hypothetical protein GCM10011489_09220 [Gordonia jinhuaensis]
MTTAHTTAPDVPGQFTLVLHSHLPWLANHGRWPVGEEWLYQSWAGSYLRVAAVLEELADEGRTDLLSLGVTPVLAAQLDDPHCLSSMHEWLADWRLRAHEAMQFVGDDAAQQQQVRIAGQREHHDSGRGLELFESRWRHGGSAVLRSLADRGAIEYLGGPLAHPFAPLLHPRLRAFSLDEGLADAAHRIGTRPQGIWAPECAYTPGMENGYRAAGVRHFMVDGPTLHGDTALGRPVGDSDVIAFGRDLTVSYRVWSPTAGYPGHAVYRDFYTYDHRFGLKASRVTGRSVPGEAKKPYDPQRTRSVLDRHVEDFVDTVRTRLLGEYERTGRPALVVAAFDTELFGHWWHEGPDWLAAVLRRLPEAGVSVGSLRTAADRGFVGERVDLPASSWGAGKDWRVWTGERVADLVALNDEVSRTALDSVDKRLAAAGHRRDPVSDQILREALLTVSSDWPFMVTGDAAAGYARDRAFLHAHATREICAAADAGREERANALAAGWARADNLFAHLDARRLPPAGFDDLHTPGADGPHAPGFDGTGSSARNMVRP